MITYLRYINQEEHVWYDSTNIIYSKLYDTSNSNEKNLKIVFKGGRTYLYKKVSSVDYVRFKLTESTGKGFNSYIKNYECIRIMDTDLEKLETLKEELIQYDADVQLKQVGNLLYKIERKEGTDEFILSLNGKELFRGIDGEFSIVRLLQSMNIAFDDVIVEELPNNSDEELNEIKI